MSEQTDIVELPMPPQRLTKPWIIGLAALLFVSFACLAYPLYVIRPFRAQGAGELGIALFVLRYRLAVTSLCALAFVVALTRYWRLSLRRWTRAALVVGFVAVCTFSALCHVNIYELMFHPNTQPAFSPAAKVKLDGGEKVIAVLTSGNARAYPIRSISYHHVINDSVGGVPIVATY